MRRPLQVDFDDELHCQYDCALGRKSLLVTVNRYDIRCPLNDGTKPAKWVTH